MRIFLERGRGMAAYAILAMGLGAAVAPAQVAPTPSHAVLAKTILPDAPQPMGDFARLEPDATLAGPDASDIREFFLATSSSKYSTTLHPGEKRVPFTVREKFIYSVRESVDTSEFFIVLAGAGFNHLIDGNPHYGSDGNGFGERVGTSALREASVHLLGDGVMASALHQDPRYFRIGPGEPLKRRIQRVLASSVTSHSDRDGHVQPDYSGITARAATAAMTLTYYPHVSATGVIATETFGYSLLGNMAGDAMLEFLPDLLKPIKKVEQKAEQQVKK